MRIGQFNHIKPVFFILILGMVRLSKVLAVSCRVKDMAAKELEPLLRG